jgi:hypothetical protein
LSRIADLLDVPKSFVTAVKAGRRSFTVEHMITLHEELGKSLPLLLIEEERKEDIPKHLIKLYEMTKAVLQGPRLASRKRATTRSRSTTSPSSASSSSPRGLLGAGSPLRRKAV